MSQLLQPALDLRKLVYSATTATTPNFGGHHGVKGFEASIGSGILKSIDTFIGSMQADKALASDLEQVRAQCNLARTMNILNDAELEEADNYLDKIRENL